jgi:transposase-like protein
VTTADEDRIAARRAEAIRLRVRGKTIREIARELGISVGLAHSDVRAVMSETSKRAAEDAETERELDLARIDSALQVVADVLEGSLQINSTEGDPAELLQALAGAAELKLKGIDRLVKLTDARAKLLGLYAPTKTENDHRVAEVSLDDLSKLKQAAQANECSPPSSDSEPNS